VRGVILYSQRTIPDHNVLKLFFIFIWYFESDSLFLSMMVEKVIVIVAAISIPVGMWMIIRSIMQLSRDDSFKDWLTGNNKKNK